MKGRLSMRCAYALGSSYAIGLSLLYSHGNQFAEFLANQCAKKQHIDFLPCKYGEKRSSNCNASMQPSFNSAKQAPMVVVMLGTVRDRVNKSF